MLLLVCEGFRGLNALLMFGNHWFGQNWYSLNFRNKMQSIREKDLDMMITNTSYARIMYFKGVILLTGSNYIPQVAVCNYFSIKFE